ncbi:pleiotropic drug resistance 12 [Perilla frutescens var. frutescens]|nr:pleiotropic drug resistance 12 [Perilla frutescens var. frutescens]
MSRDNLTDGRMFSGAIFFVVSTVMFGGMSEIVMTILKLPVFYRQRNSFFFPAWAYALPQWIFSIPVNVLQIAVVTALTYYEIGFDPNFGRFIKYYLLLLTLVQAGSSLFRLLGAIGRNMIIAFLYGYFMLLLVFALSGFVLPRDTINKWWIWGYYISPMMYAENAIMVNEFTGHSWRHVSPYANVSLGVEVLKFQGFFPSSCWYWIGVGALIGMTFLFTSCCILALTYLSLPVKPQAIIIPEDENEVSTEKKGELWLQMLEHNL